MEINTLSARAKLTVQLYREEVFGRIREQYDCHTAMKIADIGCRSSVAAEDLTKHNFLNCSKLPTHLTLTANALLTLLSYDCWNGMLILNIGNEILNKWHANQIASAAPTSSRRSSSRDSSMSISPFLRVENSDSSQMQSANNSNPPGSYSIIGVYCLSLYPSPFSPYISWIASFLLLISWTTTVALTWTMHVIMENTPCSPARMGSYLLRDYLYLCPNCSTHTCETDFLSWVQNEPSAVWSRREWPVLRC